MPNPTVSAGLCSVTLRQLPAPEVAAAAAAAGLSCVEWGGDVHFPPGDVRAAAVARAAGVERGLRAASYGSCFRAGPDGAAQFAPVLVSAVALGVPRIRIWAGAVGSADASPAEFAATVRATRNAADRAAEAGVELAFEYHAGTLADTAGSALRLLGEVAHPAVRAYWQPPVGMATEQALADLERMLPWVAAVHVFSWWPGTGRLPLEARAELWGGVFALLGGAGRAHDALLEFVPGDDPEQLARDAAALRGLLG